MVRVLLCGAALSLVALAVQAQPPASTAVNPPAANPPAAATPPAADTTATVSPYRTGMTIKDAQGMTIGTIARVIKTPDGATTISATVDGRTVNLPASAVTIGADGTAVSSMSKAQITASTKPPA
jgi:hypothetical protein